MTKKIVFLIRNVAPEKFGGAEVYQLKLAEKLKEAGFCPAILTNSEELLKRAKKAGIQTLVPPYCKRQNWSGVWNLGLPFYFLYQLRLRKWYKKIFRKYKPEVVNIQSRDDWLAATQAAKKCKIKTLWTDHADFRNWVLWNVNTNFKNIIGKNIIKASKDVYKVIFVSENIRRETDKLIFPKKMKDEIVIQNGIEDDFDKYKNIKSVEKSFVYVGRVTKDKGMSELVEAFKIVLKKHKDAKLNIFGEGDVEYYKNIVGDYSNIVFYGLTNEPLKAIAENEIFVLPSYREGLSISLLEAAMMGKKIIASDVDGNSEVITNKKTGLLVPAKSVDKLVEAMLWMLKYKKEADIMAKNARKLYERNFDFDKIFAEKMLPLYNIEKEKK